MMRRLPYLVFLLLVFCVAALPTDASLNGSPPTTEYLKSDPIECKASENLCSLPGVTNFRSQVQADRNITGYRMFTAPPITTRFYREGNNLINGTYAELYLKAKNGYLINLKDHTTPVTTTSYFDKVVRTQKFVDLELSSTLTMASDADAVLLELTITNTGTTVWTDTNIILSSPTGTRIPEQAWGWGIPGAGEKSATTYENNTFIFSDDGSAYSILGLDTVPSSYAAHADSNSWRQDISDDSFNNQIQPQAGYISMTYPISLQPGKSMTLRWVHVLDQKKESGVVTFQRLLSQFPQQSKALETEWNRVLKAAITPKNDVFSGSVPVLKTSDPNLEKFYYVSLASVIAMRRADPDSIVGTTYVTLFPESGVTVSYLWDTQLASSTLAMLDPVVLRQMIETFMKIDLNKHYAYDYLSGTGNGPWYSVNDYALVEMSYNYLRYSGDTAWLSKSVQGKTVLEHLTTAATNWKQRNSSDNLADYGENKNLLEVMKRYTHKVPSLNAANVWINRTVAQMHRIQGNTKRAAELEADAQKILDAVKTLYVSGEGVWNAKTPAGLQQNRHVYDLAVILNTIGDDLTQEQKKEMVRFFQTELQTPTWMRALSNKDVGIGESIRADHQNTGAYISWPGLTLLGLYKNGFHTDASAWLGAGKEVGLHQVVRQGQLGQAYWHGAADGTSGNKTINGVAQKASYEYFELKNGTPDF